VSAEGSVAGSHQVFYPTHYPAPGFAEQNPDEIYEAVMAVLKKISSETRRTHKIRGIALSSAMHSIMAVSLNGEALSPLIIWADTRSTLEARALKNSSLSKILHQQTGTPIHPMSPFCKLLWWKRSDKKLNKAHKFISIKEYILFQLTSEFVVDYSIASASGLFHLHNRQWHPEALAITGITDKQLSQPVSPLYTLTLLPVVSKSLSLTDVPLIVGASDGCLAQLGSGAMGETDLTITIGTSAAVRRAVKEIKEDPQQRLFNYWLDDEMLVSGGASNNGTAAIDWYVRAFRQSHLTLPDFVKEALTAPPGCEGLIALPYLSGERAPVYNAEARGVFFGISVRHEDPHFKRALLEGICFEIVSLIESVESVHGTSGKIFISGGFTHAPAWVQLLSDISGRTLWQGEWSDASSIGAAILGFRALRVPHQTDHHKTFEIKPQPQNFSLYQGAYKKFGRIYEQLNPLFGG
jgi:gluconokinase